MNLHAFGAAREGVFRRDGRTWSGYIRDTVVFSIASSTRCKKTTDIRVAGIGTGFDVSQYYTTSHAVRTLGDIGHALIGLIEDSSRIPRPPSGQDSLAAKTQ